MATNSGFFDGTCELFDLRNCSGEVLNERLIDPCSCYRFYQCSQTYEMRLLDCPRGTAWDYKQNLCDDAKKVTLNQPCNETWKRCDVSESRLKQLEYQCKQHSSSTVLPTLQTTFKPSNESSSGGTNPGVIIGAVIAGAVLTAIVIIAIGLYRRRMKARIPAKRPTIANNPEYFEGGNTEDPYAIIHDAHIADTNMQHPMHSSGNGTIPNTDTTSRNARFEEDLIEYDNTGSTTADGYTSTMRRSIREYETPARATGNNPAEVKLDVDTTPGTSTDENGNEHRKQIDTSLKMSVSSISSHDNIGTLTSLVTESESAPDYYKLEKTGVLSQEQDNNN